MARRRGLSLRPAIVLAIWIVATILERSLSTCSYPVRFPKKFAKTNDWHHVHDDNDEQQSARLRILYDKHSPSQGTESSTSPSTSSSTTTTMATSIASSTTTMVSGRGGENGMNASDVVALTSTMRQMEGDGDDATTAKPTIRQIESNRSEGAAEISAATPMGGAFVIGGAGNANGSVEREAGELRIEGGTEMTTEMTTVEPLRPDEGNLLRGIRRFADKYRVELALAFGVLISLITVIGVITTIVVCERPPRGSPVPSDFGIEGSYHSAMDCSIGHCSVGEGEEGSDEGREGASRRLTWSSREDDGAQHLYDELGERAIVHCAQD